MTSNTLEHLNFTVSNPDATAAVLCEIFDWQIRWSGVALDAGRTVHVGNGNQGGTYLALYAHQDTLPNAQSNHISNRNLNHIGILVDDIEATEQRLLEMNIVTSNHADYDPGRRFYFFLEDDIEVEVISYN